LGILNGEILVEGLSSVDGDSVKISRGDDGEDGGDTEPMVHKRGRGGRRCKKDKVEEEVANKRQNTPN